MNVDIQATSNEREMPNVIDIEDELRKVARPSSMPAVSGFRSKGRGYNAEFDEFYNKSEQLRQVAKRHSWTRATVSAIARATVGGGFSFTRHPVYGQNINIKAEEMDAILEPVYDFFFGTKSDIRYIQDITTLPAKIYYSVLSLVFYGQCAWEILRDENGLAIGFDVLAGIVRPNVNHKGRFLRPAYYFRPWNSAEVVSYRKPTDVLYLTWPGVDMSIYGSSEFDAVIDISIPSDLYASTSYRNHFENSNAPYSGFWVVDKDTNEDDFKRFLITLVNRYSGVVNFGRTPIVIRGNAEFKETRSRSNDDAPYLEGRRYNQEEISAVAAVPSAKLGLAANTTKTNFREQRREFHENTLRPVFEIIEHGIYQQIIVREFGIKDWMLNFNSPDLTTAIEAATINARYIQNGVYTPNEVREIEGKPPRDDEGGNTYYRPSNAEVSTGETESEQEVEGSSSRQFEQARIPTQDRQEEDSERKGLIDRPKVVNELKTWRSFALRVSNGKRNDRPFNCQHIPQGIATTVQNNLDKVTNNPSAIKALFGAVIDKVDDYNASKLDK